MISLLGARAFLMGSRTAQLVAVCVMALIGVWGYGKWQYWQGGKEKATQIINKSNKVAVKKNKKARKVRARVPVSAARKRLLEYARPN